mgnify:CR=1 FL=1
MNNEIINIFKKSNYFKNNKKDKYKVSYLERKRRLSDLISEIEKIESQNPDTIISAYNLQEIEPLLNEKQIQIFINKACIVNHTSQTDGSVWIRKNGKVNPKVEKILSDEFGVKFTENTKNIDFFNCNLIIIGESVIQNEIDFLNLNNNTEIILSGDQISENLLRSYQIRNFNYTLCTGESLRKITNLIIKSKQTAKDANNTLEITVFSNIFSKENISIKSCFKEDFTTNSSFDKSDILTNVYINRFKDIFEDRLDYQKIKKFYDTISEVGGINSFFIFLSKHYVKKYQNNLQFIIMFMYKDILTKNHAPNLKELYLKLEGFILNNNFITTQELENLKNLLFGNKSLVESQFVKRYQNHDIYNLKNNSLPSSIHMIRNKFLTEDILVSDLIDNPFPEGSAYQKLASMLYNNLKNHHHFKCPYLQLVLFFQYKNNDSFINQIINTTVSNNRYSLLSLLSYLHFPEFPEINKLSNLLHEHLSKINPEFSIAPESWLIRNLLYYPKKSNHQLGESLSPDIVFNTFFSLNRITYYDPLSFSIFLFYFKELDNTHFYNALVNHMKFNDFDIEGIPYFLELFDSLKNYRMRNNFTDPYPN